MRGLLSREEKATVTEEGDEDNFALMNYKITNDTIISNGKKSTQP